MANGASRRIQEAGSSVRPAGARWHIRRPQTLTGIKAQDRAIVTMRHRMANLIFKCPHTGMNVQHWLPDEPADDSNYETVVCQACSRLHFINRSNGKLLGAEEE